MNNIENEQTVSKDDLEQLSPEERIKMLTSGRRIEGIGSWNQLSAENKLTALYKYNPVERTRRHQ